MGVEPLPGESEAAYVARQNREREEAAERMRAKFGGSGGLNGKLGGCGPSGFGSSGGYGGGSGGGAKEWLSGLGSAATMLGSSAVAVLGAAHCGTITPEERHRAEFVPSCVRLRRRGGVHRRLGRSERRERADREGA